MFENCQNISRRKTQITKQTTLLLKTESQEVIVDVSWSECSNLNVINITISMRYLPVTIILPGLVITTLSAGEQRDNRLVLEAIFPMKRMRTPLTGVTTFSSQQSLQTAWLRPRNQPGHSLKSPDFSNQSEDSNLPGSDDELVPHSLHVRCLEEPQLASWPCLRP